MLSIVWYIHPYNVHVLAKSRRRLESSKEICRYLGSSHIRGDEEISYKIEITGGRCSTIRGTYLNKGLKLAISTWISPEFYIKCSKIINDYFLRDFTRLKDTADGLQKRYSG